MNTSPAPRPLFGMSANLPAELADDVAAILADWTKNNKVGRLWEKDATLWTGTDEGQWLGWLGIVDEQLAWPEKLTTVADEIRAGGFTHAVLLGMGGSSLCVEVMKLTFGRSSGFPEMFVLDSTDPAQVRAVEKQLDIAKTLFIVSSKSGTTLEPNIFQQYFYGRAKEVLGAKAAQHFIAITDPGSQLEKVAKAEGFRHVAPGIPSIGGRYSALSNFGMVPAAVQGLDVQNFLQRTLKMVQACDATSSPKENPGVQLGAILGAAALRGRDKITLIVGGVHWKTGEGTDSRGPGDDGCPNDLRGGPIICLCAAALRSGRFAG
jgi:glucose-6-phosphate isomerase